MSAEEQVFADMALHSLETDIADLERLAQTPTEKQALRAEYLRLDECFNRLAGVLVRVKAKAAA